MLAKAALLNFKNPAPGVLAVANDAAGVPFTPTGAIAATDVQAAIAELDTEKLAAASYTAADVLSKLLTVDGAGSGLDADLLDGNSSAAFGLVASSLAQFAATTSLELKTLISDETGSGALVFGTSPSFTTEILPVANDSAALGSVTLRWSDLFLADGGIINIGTTSSKVSLQHVAASDSLQLFADPDNATAGSQFEFYVDGAATPEWVIDASILRPGADNSIDIGDTSFAVRTLYLGTSLELGHDSDTTLTRSAAGKLDVEGHTLLSDDEENQPLTGGVTVTSKSLGTITTGTLTLDMGDRPLQHYTNGGAHTLDPGAAKLV